MKDEPETKQTAWHKMTDLKNVLVHLLHQSNYTRELDQVAKALIDYIGKSINETAALFFYDKALECYFYSLSTFQRLDSPFANVTFSREDVETLLNGQSMAEISSIYPVYDSGNKLFLWPLKNGNTIYALLLLTCSKEMFLNIDNGTLKQFTSVIQECSKLLFVIQNYIHDKKMGRRYQQLFTVTKKFHSSMDDREVLDVVIRTIASHYPTCAIDLLFNEKNEVRKSQHPYAVQAFLSGTVQSGTDGENSLLFAPLAGRQGVYGVIEIKAKDNERFFKEDIEFISLLATTAGHAFENAKLFQQSQRSISDLRLINKTIQRLNANLRYNETVDYLLKEVMENFLVDEIGFFDINSTLAFKMYPGSTSFFKTEKGKKMVERIIAEINENHESLFRGDAQTETTEDVLYKSLVALPLIQDDLFFGVVVVLHKDQYHFSFDGFRLMQALVRHSTLALTNARLREKLEYKVITDQLTGLYTRDYFNKKIEHHLGMNLSGVMILIDIDDFKLINDTYGHIVGDETLISVAEIIKDNIRQGDIAARWGGEELAMYLPECDLKVGQAIADRLVKSVQDGTNPKVTISCGISYWGAPEFLGGGGSQKLFVMADKALYRAKEDGKNCIRIYN